MRSKEGAARAVDRTQEVMSNQTQGEPLVTVVWRALCGQEETGRQARQVNIDPTRLVREIPLWCHSVLDRSEKFHWR